MPNLSPLIAIVAGELSGDLLGASLIEHLRAERPATRFALVAGPRMREAAESGTGTAGNTEILGDIETLSVMGLVEVVGHLPRLLLFYRSLVKRLVRLKPDVVIGIDAPDFNLRLETRLKKAGLKTVHVVSPTVWAWRKGRTKTVARAADRLLCLFPFEPAYYAGLMETSFIGHPLADTLAPAPSGPVRARLGLPENGLVLAVLPGSRGSEVGLLAEPFAGACRLLLVRHPDLRLVIPVAKPSLLAALEAAFTGLPVTWLTGRSHEAATSADAVLLASGTATLETLLLGRPMVVGYRLSTTTVCILRGLKMMDVDKYSLPNHLCPGNPVPELIQEDATAEKLAAGVGRLLDSETARHAQTVAFDTARDVLKQDAGERAAEVVLELVDSRS